MEDNILECHNLCRECFGDLRNECSACYGDKHSILQPETSTCICEDQFYLEGDACKRMTLAKRTACEPPCKTCRSRTHCLECDSAHRTLIDTYDPTGCVFPCPEIDYWDDQVYYCRGSS